MKKNMGTTDRVIRFIVAAVIGVLYYTGTISGTLGIVLLVLAGVFGTAFVFTCFRRSFDGGKNYDHVFIYLFIIIIIFFIIIFFSRFHHSRFL